MSKADWRITILRLVVFPQLPMPLATDVFSAFAGAPPDSQEDRVRQATRVQTGPFESGVLQVTLSPISLNLMYAPSLQPNELFAANAIDLGGVDEALARLEHRTLQWLEKWETPTLRVALIVNARAPANSTVGAYKILEQNLKSVRVDPERMSDLTFRVNWRKNTNLLEEGYFNQLSTWNAVRLIAAAGAGPGTTDRKIFDDNFAQLEIDLNTPAERSQPLPREQIAPIYRELFAAAADIVENGEPS